MCTLLCKSRGALIFNPLTPKITDFLTHFWPLLPRRKREYIVTKPCIHNVFGSPLSIYKVKITLPCIGKQIWQILFKKVPKTKYFSQSLTKILRKKSRFQSFLEFKTTLETINIFELFSAYYKGKFTLTISIKNILIHLFLIIFMLKFRKSKLLKYKGFL